MNKKEATIYTSKYHGVQVVWDEDNDERILPVVDALLLDWHLAGHLLAAGESEGVLTILVRKPETRKYADLYSKLSKEGIDVPMGNDWWTVYVRTVEDGASSIIHTGTFDLYNCGYWWEEV